MDGTQTAPENKNLWWYIAGGAVAAVIGIGTCVFLFFKKKEDAKKEDKKEEKPAEAPAHAEAEKKAA